MSIRVLVILGGVALYGMERGVIEIFDLLRPEVDPHFLISQTPRQLGLPLFDEIEKRKFNYSFLSDRKGWGRLGKPRSFSHLCKMLVGLLRGNLDALREIRRHNILYVPNLFAVYHAFFAMLFCRLTGRRILYHFHDLYPRPSSQLRLVSFFVTDFVHNSRLGWCDVAAANPYITRKRNVIIPCPVRRKPSDATPQGVTTSNGSRNLVFVGQIARHKGVDILLDAFDQLSRSHFNLTLQLLGGCDDEALKERLAKTSSRNGCQVKWWGYRDDVADFLKAAYIYIHPSRPSICNESFGIGMVEAMSLGVPGVCFRSGALQEIVVHEQTGLICDEERSETLAAALDRLLGDVRLRNECGERARQRYQEHYSPPIVKALWLKTLKGA